MAKKRKSDKEMARNREYQKEYYAKNKESMAQYRRDRYKNDPEYAQKMRTSAKSRYWLGIRPATLDGSAALPSETLDILDANGVIPVLVNNPKDLRHGVTLQVPVYTTAAVATLVGRNSQTIRVWLSEGVLPEPYHRGREVPVKVAKGANPRLFTQDEMQAIEDCRDLLTTPSHGKQHDIFATAIQKRFAELVQGLVPRTE